VRPTRLRKPGTDAIAFLADSGSNADLYWATRFLVTDPLIWVELDGESYLLVKDLELGRAQKQATVDHVVPSRPIEERIRERGAIPTLADVLWEFLLERTAAGRGLGDRPLLVPQSFPFGAARRLEKLGARLEPLPSTQFPARAIKIPEEIAAIESSQRAAESALSRVIEVLGASKIGEDGYLHLDGERLTCERVRLEAHRTLLESACHASESIIAPGDQGCDPHLRGSGPIRAHETIVVDLFPRSTTTGYWGDITRTVVRGRAAPEVRRLWIDVLEAQEHILSLVRAGADGQSLHSAAVRFFEERGRLTTTRDGQKIGFIHGTGHGVGLEIHEAPSLGRNPSPLSSGNVITVEPGLYYFGLGAVRIEDTVLVTPDGHRNLTTLPKFLEID
jgi:Xaa-Pro aminopeptidase